MNLEQIFARASRASEELMSEREEARAGAIRAIGDMERKLRACLAGDTLRGLVNLHRLRTGAPVRGTSVQLGARVVGRNGAYASGFAVTDRKVDEALAFGEQALVLTKEGNLVVYWVDDRGVFGSRAVEDSDITAQDLDAVAHTVAHVLERHAARAERTAANYERLRELAGAIRGALTPKVDF